jgi:hypothetical protein
MRKNDISMPQNSYIYPDYIQLGGLMELNQCNIKAELTEPLSTRFEELITILNDTTGYFYLDLIPSDSLTPSDRLYEFTISRGDGTILRHRMLIPDSSSWQLKW